MPWKVEKDVAACSMSKPFAVKKQGGGLVPGGCHATRGDALRHQRALYSSESDAAAVDAIDLELRAEERKEQGKVLRRMGKEALRR